MALKRKMPEVATLGTLGEPELVARQHAAALDIDFMHRAFPAGVAELVERTCRHARRFAEGLPAVSDVPDKPASLDVWIKSGRVSRLEFDLGQFLPAAPDDLNGAAEGGYFLENFPRQLKHKNDEFHKQFIEIIGNEVLGSSLEQLEATGGVTVDGVTRGMDVRDTGGPITAPGMMLAMTVPSFGAML